MAIRICKSLISLLCLAGALSAWPGPAAHADALSNLPSLGDAGGAELSVQDERRLGALIMRDYKAYGAVNSDPEITGYLTKLGAKIAQAAGESPANFEFFLVTDKAINAFAMPGGYIGVHTGLIAAARNESELASVLAHEVGHVTQRHIARRFGQQKQTTMVSAAAMIAAILVASSNPQAATGIMAAGAGYGIDQQLAFSRDAEREADRVGFQTLQSAGFNTQGMVDFFGRLQTASRLYENNAPAYLRTHPLTTERIADIRNRVGIDAGKGVRPPAPLDFELLRMKALVYGDKSNQQWSDRLKALSSPNEQDGFTNPIALEYGKSLVYANLLKKREAQEAADRSLELFRQSMAGKPVIAPLMLQSQVIETRLDAAYPSSQQALNVGSPKLVADLNNDGKVVLALLERLKNDYRNELSAKVLYADGLQRLGLFQQSDTYLRDLTQIYRSNPQLFELLSQSALALGKRADHHLYLAQSYSLRGAYLPAIEQTQIAKQYAQDNYYLLAEIDAKQREYKRKADEEREYLKASGNGP
ncbi:M48 family metalloprotease [Limnobacter humi]|uniref:M48 family metalloprotease n=1 Tax=Limnobacter humi TaxID=1778671 RepID=A0ABT1WBE9_9BURK|nr:M48 family metalloprotease [Limnobacter humi]MCQ8894845.1 M48 family metalloprotease [Limnobacter humi]